MPGAHKIGAAISGPRIAGGNFMDITLVLREKATEISARERERERETTLPPDFNKTSLTHKFREEFFVGKITTLMLHSSEKSFFPEELGVPNACKITQN